MAIYSIKNNKLEEVHEQPYRLEREIQEIFEANLNDVMGLRLVRSEFSIKNKRIDTLAYDEQSNAFIIIEYKRDKNISVVDQGFTYLGLMLENKADMNQASFNKTFFLLLSCCLIFSPAEVIKLSSSVATVIWQSYGTIILID